MKPLTKPLLILHDQWQFYSTGNYQGTVDHRGLLQICHPWTDSHQGHLGEWRIQVKRDPDWLNQKTAFLSFYQSDNYSVSKTRDHDWSGLQAFVGHRFKQLLINDHLVWEADVADEEVTSTAYTNPYRVVDISHYLTEPITLVFRVIDKVSSRTKLPEDHYWRFIWGESDPNQAQFWFQTKVFFGDVIITPSPEPVQPVTQRIEIPSHKRHQPKPRHNEGLSLKLQMKGALPREGYPVRCGVPFPRGRIQKGTLFNLLNPKGELIPSSMTETSYWSDGSVRWILCEFVAKRKGTWRLVPGRRKTVCRNPVKVQTDATGLVLSNGCLLVKIGTDREEGLFDEVHLRGILKIGPSTFSIKLNRVGWLETFRAVRQKVSLEKANDICAILRIDGEFRSEQGTRFGPWSARLFFWTNLPYLLIEWQLINESDQAMAMLLDWSARFSLPEMVGAVADFGNFQRAEDSDLDEDISHRAGLLTVAQNMDPHAIPLLDNSFITCRQETADSARLYCVRSLVGKTEHAPGFVHVKHQQQSLVASMRWFAEEFPKGLILRPQELCLATLPQPEDVLNWHHDTPRVLIGRGEAKRQTLVLWLSDDELSRQEVERFSACVQDPPRFYDRHWFLNSGALDTGPARQTPALRKWEKTVGIQFARSGVDMSRLGHREYWDTAWMNDYRGRAHLGLLRYMETGDAQWFRYLEATCRHLSDVDLIHFSPEHPEWVGSCHEYSADHTSGHPMSNIGLNSDDLLEHYLMTGDTDSLAAAQGLAEHILQCPTWSRSARAVGWPLAQVSRWYDQTHDERFLTKAKELFLAAQVYTEPRRGIFDEFHGNLNYHGSVPFMTAYLAYGVIRYHQATGDLAALEFLCKLADGLLAECQPEPGFFCYSPFPENNLYRHCSGTAASTCSWSVNIGGLCGYIYLKTGNVQYGKAARDCFASVVQNPEQVAMDMVQLGGWLLQAVAGTCK